MQTTSNSVKTQAKNQDFASRASADALVTAELANRAAESHASAVVAIDRFSALTAAERETLRVAHTLKRDDAIACLSLKPGTYDERLTAIRIKFRDQANLKDLQIDSGSRWTPHSVLGRGYRRNVLS